MLTGRNEQTALREIMQQGRALRPEQHHQPLFLDMSNF